MPEAPVAKPAKEAAKALPPNAEKGAQCRGARSQAAAPGSVVQLGAFANQAQAERAWTALSSRFPASPRSTR